MKWYNRLGLAMVLFSIITFVSANNVHTSMGYDNISLLLSIACFGLVLIVVDLDWIIRK